MLARVWSCALQGVEGVAVDVEVEVGPGRPKFSIIGLGDGAIREARERITAAIRHSGFDLPAQILVNLAPAELKKEGGAFDLPMALAILCASNQLPHTAVRRRAFFGELALDGTIKPVRGLLALCADAATRGVSTVVVPSANVEEALLVEQLEVAAGASLREVVALLRSDPLPVRRRTPLAAPKRDLPQLSEVWGQEAAKRALIVSAAGEHNLLMVGPPGCGKSMLAQRLPALLPPLSPPERLEVIRVHSAAGQRITPLLAGERPFRSPHHVVSDVGLVGGGLVPKPGEISLAHRGVLFLDEFPEFRRSALEALRGPLEDGKVTVTRARGHTTFPAQFQLVAAMNPCPCGRLGSSAGACSCSRPAILSYLAKLSGPILDRIDLHVDLDAIPLEVLQSRLATHESTIDDGSLAASIARARAVQLKRQGTLNARLRGHQLRAVVNPEPGAMQLIERAAHQGRMSARGVVKVLRVARTIADLEGSDPVRRAHLAEALGFRSLERIRRLVEGR